MTRNFFTESTIVYTFRYKNLEKAGDYKTPKKRLATLNSHTTQARIKWP